MNILFTDLDTTQQKELYTSLYSYAKGLFRFLYKTEVNERGKSFCDYVHDAIEMHQKGEDNYDPQKASLDYHLKRHIIKRAMYNDFPARLKKLRSLQHQEQSESNLTPVPHRIAESYYELQVEWLGDNHMEMLYQNIEQQIEGDEVVETIYLAVRSDGFRLSDRAEICKEYQLTDSQFDNGRRRFLTVLKGAFKRFNIKFDDYEK